MSGAPMLRGAELRVEALNKTYDLHRALNNLSLTVAPEMFQALLGPSGSGKTSLLMSVAGFLRPDSGRIVVNGRDVTQLPPEKRRFGMVFQGYALFPHMSVIDNVAFGLRARGVGLSERRRKAGAAVELVRLSGLETRYPRQLSGGQQQRVALARAIACEPELLLLDEPLSALDRSLRGDLQIELRALQRKTGLTCLYVTHDQDEALSMADNVAVLTGGGIVQSGPPAELYERPASRFVASFLGKSNFLELDLVDGGGEIAVCRRADVVLRHRGARRSSGPILLALRPEKIAVVERPEPGRNAVSARLASVSYFGASAELLADAGALGALIVRAPSAQAASLQVGDAITLSWPYDAAVEIMPDASGESDDQRLW
jgi:putative spermidine/putrescine transport system ATP-binding protein